MKSSNVNLSMARIKTLLNIQYRLVHYKHIAFICIHIFLHFEYIMLFLMVIVVTFKLLSIFFLLMFKLIFYFVEQY